MVSEVGQSNVLNNYFNIAKERYRQDLKNVKDVSIITFRAIKVYHCKPYPQTIEAEVTNSDGTKSIQKRTVQIKFKKLESEKKSVTYETPVDSPQFKDELFKQLIFADEMTEFPQEENACLGELQITIRTRNEEGILKITTSGLCKDSNHIYKNL